MLPAQSLISWFDAHGRSLPWRGESATPWRVLVSEFMLQQTPVNRVIPRFLGWMQRWPTPADLAAATGAEVLREWANLGYPRRALWLRDAAEQIESKHAGSVPDNLDDLLRLHGVGDYTARAVLAFGFGQKVPVVDTNVRRVLARVDRGVAISPVRTRTDMTEVAASLPEKSACAAKASLAYMEFGALVCTARAPLCDSCPITNACAWRAAGYPAGSQATQTRQKAYIGSDRQVRGRILAMLRNADDALRIDEKVLGWPDAAQVSRAVHSLFADGLISSGPADTWKLPE